MTGLNEKASLDAFADACAAAIGRKHVLSGADDIAAYTSDFWHQYHGIAAYVLRPGTTGEVSQIVRLANEFDVELIIQAGNTGLVNGSIPDKSGRQVVLSVNRMNAIRAVESNGGYMIVEAGCILADAQKAAADVGKLFPLSLGAEGSCRIGGTLATNAGGINVLRYGTARDLALGLEVVLPDGSIWNGLKPLRKDNTGYDLKQLFIGSEGTLGIITAATLRLFPEPRERVTMWLAVDQSEDAVRLFNHFRERFGELISSFELLNSDCVELALKHLPGVRRPVANPSPWHVLVELAWSFDEGLQAMVERSLETLFADKLCTDGTWAESEQQRQNMWRIREGQSEAARNVGEIVRSDVAVAVEEIPSLLAEMQEFTIGLDRPVTFLPFGHVGDGNVHVNFLVSREDYPALSVVLLDRLFSAVEARNGSISAEHGVGRAKRDAVAAIKSPVAVEMMRQIKSVFDPRKTLNSGIGVV